MTQSAATLPFMSEERIQSQIKLTRHADEAIEQLMKELGMTKIELLSRVCLWFTAQHDVLRKGILGLIPHELMREANKVMVENLFANQPIATPEERLQENLLLVQDGQPPLTPLIQPPATKPRQGSKERRRPPRADSEAG